MKAIVQKNEEILREKATEVPLEAIASEKIAKIIEEMKEALASQDDGVAIAAPQIGYSLRIFVMSKHALYLDKAEEKPIQENGHLIFINPKIKKLSKTTDWMEEGCLSVRYLYGFVKRATKATISAYDQLGEKFEMGASGLIAQIFQHEIDHLDGILFIDKAKDVQELPPEQTTKEPAYNVITN